LSRHFGLTLSLTSAAECASRRGNLAFPGLLRNAVNDSPTALRQLIMGGCITFREVSVFLEVSDLVKYFEVLGLSLKFFTFWFPFLFPRVLRINIFHIFKFTTQGVV
jgi:hypothetical protein